ncbi:FxLYD domain-containing protein [Halalkalicoccus ordinarius]|uniref:FxLYD domain-containing protein n=1 Tax=Halalkalicoccus ordinarius TaxID=3116651 RepID=UPI00300F25F3
MKRRPLLTTGLLAVSGAGCVGRFTGGDSEPGAGSREGENGSADATETIDDGESANSERDVQVIRMDRTTDTIGTTATITARNLASETLDAVDVTVIFYDEIDSEIGPGLGGITDVSAGEGFEITIRAEGPQYTDAAAFEITDLTVE